MADTITEQAVLPPAIPQITLKMTAEEIFKQIETYKTNAEASIVKLQQSIEKQTENLNQLQKMWVTINGQRELVLDLYNKITGGTEQPKA